MEQLENRMVLDDCTEKHNNYDDYLEHLLEEDDRRYEDEILKGWVVNNGRI